MSSVEDPVTEEQLEPVLEEMETKELRIDYKMLDEYDGGEEDEEESEPPSLPPIREEEEEDL